MRESSALGDLLSMKAHERPVVFYAEDSFTYVQLRGYVEALISRHSIPVRYVTSDPQDPLFEKAPTGMTVHFVDRQLPRLMAGLRTGVVVLTMPDLGAFHVPVPNGAKTFYVFHSLNSAHTSYRAGAFDHYDHVACTGPHHVAELGAMRVGRGLPAAELHEVGYHKLDRIADEYRQYVRSVEAGSIVIAPSWAPANLLEAHGSAIVERLRSDGFEVVVRPHPQFFHSLYPRGREVMDELTARFGRDPGVRFEMSISNQVSFYRSDLMISDWSGAAFEYALGTLRPVLFVATPQKLSNSEWSRYGLPAFESDMRARVGRILDPSEISTIGSVARAMIQDRDSLARGLEEARESLVFNFGRSAEVGADLIADLST
jgi:YidC/Oxa1 family membrane protein insertase